MKFLWRANVAGVARPIYLVSQNLQSAAAQASNHPQVQPEDVRNVQRVDEWNDAQNMTVVLWPPPPPEPDPQEPPPP